MRRHAFVALLRSDDWRLVLAPHVISCQGFRIRETVQPDEATFAAAAAAIADNEEQIQRALELAGTRFSAALLGALAAEMGPALVEPALTHLRNADGMRSAVLQQTLQAADPNWVRHSLAGAIVRRQLRQDQPRIELVMALQRAGCLADYVDVFHAFPPVSLEEWSALGLAQIADQRLFEMAMRMLPHAPAPLLYLLRLDPLPAVVAARVIASARGDWIAAAIEMALVEGLDSPLLIVLAEMGVRAGGRSLATSTAWISMAKMAKPLLMRLGVAMDQGGRSRVSELLWIRREAPSADRALESGRKGRRPEFLDAATLVRQTRGARAIELVREIITHPRPQMIETVLRHLCAVNEEAAIEILRLCDDPKPEVAARAQSAREWNDVLWPSPDRTQEIECE